MSGRSSAGAARARLALATMAALALATAVAGCGGAEEGGTDPGAPERTRIGTARVYQHNHWTVPGQTPASVGKALASLKPSWVSSLIRYTSDESPIDAEKSAWKTIRDAVRAEAPEAQFGIELNALEYQTADEVTAMMDKLRPSFDNDGWFFDFYTPAYAKYPDAVEAAVENAHSNGEWIGGNAFGLDKPPRIPPDTDFIAVQDFRFRIDLAAVRRLAEKLPVVFHLGNSPGQANSDGCQFIKELNTPRRIAYITERASQQAANDFRFGYPVFFPECERPSTSSNPGVYTYEAPRDGSMMETIGELMSRYD